ncbi:FeS assembly ATPase SufC [Candidatus Carsonella ruddii CS isolate Thao2000]|uniref:FeS assembly ATPase SufC n=1 Tax=Candidatus Carsonella ruddii CS isolate Thao2000 TaxID=1202537 RepID=J7H082_CARRU|nr:ATP-binding cassette domain-containing protein [Candidatus Carsonella ruddii]AFP83700.1 FeS assembly ATPase SufC [Candidatus Carsonella ruddii CS isolate Thao2000]
MIKIKKLFINCKNILLFKNINFFIEFGKIYILLGKNGIGKSTFLKSFLNDENYCIKGEIIFNKTNILNYSTDYICRIGIYYFHQSPIEIFNIKNLFLLKTCYEIFNFNKKNFFKKIKVLLKNINFNKKLLFRNLNYSFSGGEKKKNEFLYLMIINPFFILLDEFDSGLEFFSYFYIINYLNKIKKFKYILLITHNLNIKKHLKIDYFIFIKNNFLNLIKCI